jgi:hypothetical protein
MLATKITESQQCLAVQTSAGSSQKGNFVELVIDYKLISQLTN